LTKTDGIGVLWTSHLVDEVALADRLIVLRRGRIVFEGPPDRLWATDKNTDPSTILIRLMGAVETDVDDPVAENQAGTAN
ncbi:MAG: ABC transporter ATP-binding protein, partial [Alphaproteobacteria bacterium]